MVSAWAGRIAPTATTAIKENKTRDIFMNHTLRDYFGLNIKDFSVTGARFPAFYLRYGKAFLPAGPHGDREEPRVG